MSKNTIKEAPIAKILEWWVSLSESERDYLCINFLDKTLGELAQAELTGVEVRKIYESILINKDISDFFIGLEFHQVKYSLDVLPLTPEEAHSIRVILINSKLRLLQS